MSTSTVTTPTTTTEAPANNTVANTLTVLTAVPAMCPTITDLITQTSGVLGTVEAAGGHVLQVIEAIVNDSAIWQDVESVFNGVVAMIKCFHFGSSTATTVAATTPAISTPVATPASLVTASANSMEPSGNA